MSLFAPPDRKDECFARHTHRRIYSQQCTHCSRVTVQQTSIYRAEGNYCQPISKESLPYWSERCHMEVPRVDEDFVRTAGRRRVRAKSLDDGDFSQSDWRHCSSVGRSDERMERQSESNLMHSRRKRRRMSHWRGARDRCRMTHLGRGGEESEVDIGLLTSHRRKGYPRKRGRRVECPLTKQSEANRSTDGR